MKKRHENIVLYPSLLLSQTTFSNLYFIYYMFCVRGNSFSATKDFVEILFREKSKMNCFIQNMSTAFNIKVLGENTRLGAWYWLG